MVSERIRAMREHIMSLKEISRTIPLQNIAYVPDGRKSAVLRHAEAVDALFRGAAINHLPGERIAGNNTTKYSPRPNHLTPADLESIRRYPEAVPEPVLLAMEERLFYLWSFIQGHIVPDKELVLREGINGVMRRIEERLESRELTEQQLDFLNACRIECRGLVAYAERHADFFQTKATEATDSRQREYYGEMSQLCRKVPAQPAETFQEALQSVWFAQVGTQFDDCANHSLGRLDQYLYPYYRRDLQEGRLTGEQARELFYEFWLKFNLGYKIQELSGTKMGLRSEDSENQVMTEREDFDIFDPRQGFSWLALKCISPTNHSDDGQTMDIAGLTPEGRDATNELSWLILEAEDELRTFEPKSVIKYTDRTDKAFLQKAYEVLSSGLGLPAITFHAQGAEGLRHYRQFDEAAILNHSHIGCIELGIPGCSYTDPMNAFLNLPKILLLSLNEGKVGGRQAGLATGPAENWEQVLANFYAQLDYFIELYTSAMNAAGPFFARYFYRPLVSALVDGCIQKAVPVDDGGSRYWNRAVNCTGFATAVNSLYAIKKAVFEEKRLGLEELRRILDSDFAGQEDLRLYLRNRVAKYGNGVEEVDRLAEQLSSRYADLVRSKRTHIGTSYRPGIYSFYEPIKSMGRLTGATPDGRKSGEVLSLNSAPAHGTVVKALSDVLHSAAAIPHSKCDNASCLDIRLAGNTPPEVIRSIVEYLSRRDVLYAQFTVADRQQLEEAYRQPEQHQDLVVRVTGYSARFVVLPKDTQEEIIQRSSWN